MSKLAALPLLTHCHCLQDDAALPQFIFKSHKAISYSSMKSKPIPTTSVLALTEKASCWERTGPEMVASSIKQPVTFIQQPQFAPANVFNSGIMCRNAMMTWLNDMMFIFQFKSTALSRTKETNWNNENRQMSDSTQNWMKSRHSLALLSNAFLC